MKYSLLNIGFGGSIVADEVIAILAPNSAPMRRLRDDAREGKRLIDATHGRKTRSIIVMKNDSVILSAMQPETLAQRYAVISEKKKPEND
jgi:extracellular matrix regulatory protein A